MTAISIRTFIGAKDFSYSCEFYKSLGFQMIPIDDKMSYFQIEENVGFYLQNAYTKEWIENSMVFLELSNFDEFVELVLSKKLDEKYTGVKFSKIDDQAWGRTITMHDPSGVLWFFGNFKNPEV